MKIISSTIFVDEQKKTQITFVIRSDSVFVFPLPDHNKAKNRYAKR